MLVGFAEAVNEVAALVTVIVTVAVAVLPAWSSSVYWKELVPT